MRRTTETGWNRPCYSRLSHRLLLYITWPVLWPYPDDFSWANIGWHGVGLLGGTLTLEFASGYWPWLGRKEMR